MNEINKFIQFLLDNSNDERVHIYKRMKYGYRHYYLSLLIEQENTDKSNIPFNYNTDKLIITIDNRNNCIELESENNFGNVIVEDTELVLKWTNILEEHLNKDIDEKVSNIIENSLKNSSKKDLHREYKMKKIFKDGTL